MLLLGLAVQVLFVEWARQTTSQGLSTVSGRILGATLSRAALLPRLLCADASGPHLLLQELMLPNSSHDGLTSSDC